MDEQSALDIDAALHLAAAAVFAYEAVALASRGRVPTISALSGRYVWLAPVVVTGLSAHLYLHWKAARLLPI